MKYTFEQKLKWVKDYMSGGWVPIPEGCPSSIGDWHDKVTRWVHVYERFGAEGLRHGRTRKFAKEQKPRGGGGRVPWPGESAQSVGFFPRAWACDFFRRLWLRAYR